MALIKGKITTRDGNFTDQTGRVLQLKGVNIDGGCKYPRQPYYPSHVPVDFNGEVFFDGDHVSFINRPFPLHEAESHLLRIKRLGYNTLRYVITWEAIEHEGPGKYDEDFIDYTIEIFKIVEKVGGLYLFIDPHQDAWSRYSGGDGAPLWTLYAAGMDPKQFNATQAAILQNYFPQDPDSYPKMLWTTNYQRLVAGTMFVLFFAGKVFAPKCIINGVNIQDYLQEHFINSFAHLCKRIRQNAPHLLEEVIVGVESMNEPSSGYLGVQDITEVPPEQELKLGTCPTIIQSLKLGMGIPTEVDEYKITVFGPRKTGSKYIDPEGAIAWLEGTAFDEHYGFKRGPGWNLGECIWAQHGVWDPEMEAPILNNYFNVHPTTGEVVDETYFISHYFVDHYAAFRSAMRKEFPEAIMFIQSPPLQIPPKLKGTDLIDDKTVFCAHYYDGMSLMFKTWNRRYNVDTLGIMRKRYANPVLGIVFGENNIRNSFRRQLAEMKQESVENLGPNVPVIFSEIGSPFDMDNKEAYDTGDFSSQTSSLDALGFAMEGSNLSHTWWNYTADNCHKWGDRFNCEDFSFWSIDDDLDDSTLPGSRDSSRPGTSRSNTPFSASDDSTLASSSSGQTSSPVPFSREKISSKQSMSVKTTEIMKFNNTNKASAGLRAIDSVIRPYALAINGEFVDAVFDLKKMKYTLTIIGGSDDTLATRIYFPDWHFDVDSRITVTSGQYEIAEEDEVLEWFHGPGKQTVEIVAFASPDYWPNSQQSYLDSFLSFFC